MRNIEMEVLASQFSETPDYRTLTSYINKKTKSAKRYRRAKEAFLRLKESIGFILLGFRFSSQKMEFYRILRSKMPAFARAISLF